jgi:hypothetical protein
MFSMGTPLFIKKGDSPYSLKIRTERDNPQKRGGLLGNVPIYDNILSNWKRCSCI